MLNAVPFDCLSSICKGNFPQCLRVNGFDRCEHVTTESGIFSVKQEISNLLPFPPACIAECACHGLDERVC